MKDLCEQRKKHDCRDHLSECKVTIASDDEYLYENFECVECGGVTTWKYKLVEIIESGRV